MGSKDDRWYLVGVGDGEVDVSVGRRGEIKSEGVELPCAVGSGESTGGGWYSIPSGRQSIFKMKFLKVSWDLSHMIWVLCFRELARLLVLPKFHPSGNAALINLTCSLIAEGLMWQETSFCGRLTLEKVMGDL